MRKMLLKDKEERKRERAGVGRGNLRHDPGLTPVKREREGRKTIGRKSLRTQHSSEKVLNRQMGRLRAKITIGGVLQWAGIA